MGFIPDKYFFFIFIFFLVFFKKKIFYFSYTTLTYPLYPGSMEQSFPFMLFAMASSEKPGTEPRSGFCPSFRSAPILRRWLTISPLRSATWKSTPLWRSCRPASLGVFSASTQFFQETHLHHACSTSIMPGGLAGKFADCLCAHVSMRVGAR